MNKFFAILGTISLSMFVAACSDTKTAKETATAETAGTETAAQVEGTKTKMGQTLKKFTKTSVFAIKTANLEQIVKEKGYSN